MPREDTTTIVSLSREALSNPHAVSSAVKLFGKYLLFICRYQIFFVPLQRNSCDGKIHELDANKT